MYFPRPVFSRPRAPITTGTISVLRPHILEISISNSLYFESFSIILTMMMMVMAMMMIIMFCLAVLPAQRSEQLPVSLGVAEGRGKSLLSSW